MVEAIVRPVGRPAGTTRWGSRRAGSLALVGIVLVVLLLASLGPASGAPSAAIAPARGPAVPSILSGIGPATSPGASALSEARASLTGASAPAALRSDAVPVRPDGPARAPGPTAVSLVWDALDGYVLALAPNITGNYSSTMANLSSPSQTWTFLGGVWTELHPATAPSSRGFAAMAYDASDGYVLLFGGVPTYGYCAPYPVTNQPGQPYYNCYNDTWRYAGGTWTNITDRVHRSPPRYFDGTNGYQTGPQLVYDALDGYALLYGENNSQTWSFSRDVWTNLTASSGSSPGVDGSMAYDASDGYVLYFGGEAAGASASPFAGSSDTWEFAHGSWTNVSNPNAIQPSPRSFASMTFDAATGQVLLFGGVSETSGVFLNFFETWSYSGGVFGTLGTWNDLPSVGGPTPRFGAQFVYDPSDNESVLFGGAAIATLTDSVSTYRDTWLLHDGNWTNGGPILSSPRTSLDVETDLMLSVVGLPFDGLATGEFVYSGLPPGCVDANAPAINCTLESTGTFQVTVLFSSGLGEANATLSLTVHADPAIESVALSRASTEPGVPVTISTSIAGGTAPFSFLYSGLPGCAGADAATFSCDPTTAGTFVLHVRAADALGLESNLSQTLYVLPDLALAPIALSASATDLGFETVAVVGVHGGVGPVELAYRGLPPGCASQNTTSLACRPNATGNFSLGVLASDSLGYGVQESTILRVNADPTISAFTVSSPTVAAGTPVTFDLSIAGGTGPFSITYRGLPWGCAASDSPTVTCSPSVGGTYPVVATATDAVGYTVAQLVTLTVTPAPSGPSGPGGLGAGLSGSFAQGILAGLVLLVVVALAGGAWAASSARRADGEELARELRERAPELASEVEDPGTESDEPTRTGPE
jgi:hypothetical protein